MLVLLIIEVCASLPSQAVNLFMFKEESSTLQLVILSMWHLLVRIYMTDLPTADLTGVDKDLVDSTGLIPDFGVLKCTLVKWVLDLRPTWKKKTN